MTKGVVYVLSNPAMDGYIKIGKTTNLEQRLKSLDNTSTPLPFRCIFAIEVEDMDQVERLAHQTFKRDRVRSNQNPFRSMFWAVQGMAAELSTGILIMQAIKKHKKNISMLVLNNRANFSKKAKGKLVFNCTAEEKINTAFKKLIDSNTPQTLWLTSKGVDENQDTVSTFEFEWTLSLKNKI